MGSWGGRGELVLATHSPKTGFKGFFSEPIDSLRVVYCSLRVL